MASPHTPRTTDASPLEHTRQMLDELDALMEQMLALPVNDLESQPPPDAPFPGGTVSATVTLLDVQSPVPLDAQTAAVPDAVGESISESKSPLCGAAPRSQETFPTQRPELDAELGPLPDELMPAALMNTRTPPVQPLAPPAWSITSIYVRPLTWINQAFDRCTSRLGWPGVWFCRPSGRNVLGILGLGFMGLSLAWLIKDWLGWTW